MKWFRFLKPKPKVQRMIVHLGSAKTGTTTIQKTFWESSEQLIRKGVLYPKLPAWHPHHLFMMPAMGFLQRSLVARFDGNYDHAKEQSLTAWRELSEAVKHHRPHTVILSSEFLLTAQKAPVFAELFDEFLGQDYQPEFLAYLRHSSDFFVSSTQQKLKASCILPIQTRPKLGMLDVYAKLGKVTVRAFDRNSLIAGDVVHDFAVQTGVKPSWLKPHRSDANVGLSAEGMILLQDYRKEHHSSRENVFTQDTEVFLSQLHQEEAKRADGLTTAKLRPEFAQFLDRATPDLLHLRDRFNLDLIRDHGVPESDMRDVKDIKHVAEMIAFDPDALNELREAMHASRPIT
ncbi:hypothetical protein [Donghicola sp. XS_ASV15]|uniref:hypothetical protein n=1 Tax=Donghicola sp. XS_ASV15 TaxID=3241295 RepID=UPI00351709A6